MRALAYNDLSADRNTVAVVQAMEAILERQTQGQSGSMVEVNSSQGGSIVWNPRQIEPTVLYLGKV